MGLNMACKKFERWISDEIDGKLASGRKSALDRHMKACAACRSYKNDLDVLQSAGKNAGKPELPEAYWAEFNSRLAAGLSPPALKNKRRLRPLVIRPRWALSVATFLLIVAAGLFFFLPRPQGLRERYIFSLEDSLTVIYQEIGEDADLESAFNQTLLASIGETLRASQEEVDPFFGENPLIWEGLTDEEILAIEDGLRIEDN